MSCQGIEVTGNAPTLSCTIPMPAGGRDQAPRAPLIPSSPAHRNAVLDLVQLHSVCVECCVGAAYALPRQGDQAEFQALVMGDGQPPPARAAQRRAFPPRGRPPRPPFSWNGTAEPAFAVREVDTLREAVAVLSVAVETDRMYAVARRAADSDGLTGLTNLARLWQDLKREIARPKRRSLACSVLILDIDGFKGINDSHEHAEGDRTLRA